MSNPATIGVAILRQAESRPDSPAVVATGFEPLSYRDLRDYVAGTAGRLHSSALIAALELPSRFRAAPTGRIRNGPNPDIHRSKAGRARRAHVRNSRPACGGSSRANSRAAPRYGRTAGDAVHARRPQALGAYRGAALRRGSPRCADAGRRPGGMASVGARHMLGDPGVPDTKRLATQSPRRRSPQMLGDAKTIVEIW